jgi:hypothetical protein
VDKSLRCDGSTLVTCRHEGPLVFEDRTECFLEERSCHPTLGCVACPPGSTSCIGTGPAQCRADGSGWDATGTCDLEQGEGCFEGICQNLCAAAERTRGYLGCEFRALDLDNGIDGILTSAAQQYALVIANPSLLEAHVVVERVDASSSEPARLVTVLERAVGAGQVEVLELPAQMLDGASDPHLNDGTHSALTRSAYRVRSSIPVAAYQFNPLQPADTFSEDASLLLPTSAWGDRYTVVAWPQTLGPVAPLLDGKQQRSFLTVVAGTEGARVTVTLGPRVIRTVGCEAFPIGRPGDRIEIELENMEVLNIETDARGADFSGTLVEGSNDIAVFVGAEMADVPFLPPARVVAADHLEEQLLPDRALGSDFVLAPMPSRSRALVQAYTDPEDAPVDPVDEPDWVRLVNAGDQTAHVTTTLDAPFDVAELDPGELWEIRLDHGTHIRSDEPLSVIQLVSGQQLTGIPNELPGGDPAMLVVPPTSLFRNDHVVMVPPHHVFDFVIVVAPASAIGTIDGEPWSQRCTPTPIDEQWVAHHCQTGFPILSDNEPRVRPGVQSDGAHTIRANLPVSVFVYGWDNYISYAYPGALQTLELL